MINLTLYQPEIAANVGAAIRTAACFAAECHIVEPCGFPWRKKDIERVALDYGKIAAPHRHVSWQQFREKMPGRVILLTTRADATLYDVPAADGDILLLGQESAGVPEDIHNGADERVRIPLSADARSLNMAVSGAIALAEWRRQLPMTG